MTSAQTLTGMILDAVADPARPLLTYYNESTGERTELSAATLGNWAAKIGNYLRDETMAAPGDPVQVDLPEHWQSAAVLLGAWWAGLQVRLDGEPAPDIAAPVFTAADRIDRYPDADPLIVVPLDPFAMAAPQLPVGVDDFGTAIRAHGDRFAPAGSGAAALGARPLSEVADAARTAAGADAITAGARVLSTREWRTADGIVTALLAPLLTGASLVWVGGTDDDERLAAIAGTENADLILR